MNIRFNHDKLCFEGSANGDWYPITQEVKKASTTLPALIDRYRIEVSLSCNLKCKYCVVHMNNVRQQNTVMSLETARTIVNQFNEEVGDKGSIFLMGGEPLTNFPVVKSIIEQAQGSTIIFTNALLLDDNLIRFFYKHNTYILTSLDGYNLRQNEKRFWPDVQKNFDKVTNNIKNAINKGCKVGVSCLLHNGNVKDAREIAEFFINDLGAKAMSFSYPHRTMGSTEEDRFDFEQYSKSLIDVYRVAKRYGVYVDQIGKIISCLAFGNPIVIGCKAGTTQRAFYPDGSETICTKIDTQKGFLMNDYINDLPYLHQACRNCIAQGLCSGECPWDFFVATRKGERGHGRVCGYYTSFVDFIINDITSVLSKAKTIDEAKALFNATILPLAKNYTN